MPRARTWYLVTLIGGYLAHRGGRESTILAVRALRSTGVRCFVRSNSHRHIVVELPPDGGPLYTVHGNPCDPELFDPELLSIIRHSNPEQPCPRP